MKNKYTPVIAFLLFFISCKEENLYLPKPRLYPKVNFPTKEYIDFSESYCKIGFRYPKYAEVVKDEYFFDDKPLDPCWFDLSIPSLNGTLHCSYFPIRDRSDLDELITDSYELAGKHNIKAEYYNEYVLDYPGNVKGVMFEIEGDVATPVQFFLSDSTNHFFRGSLYFQNQVRPDSMAPVYEFVRQDIDTLLSTFYWQ